MSGFTVTLQFFVSFLQFCLSFYYIPFSLPPKKGASFHFSYRITFFSFLPISSSSPYIFIILFYFVFFLFHHGGNKYFFPLIERLLNNFHPFGFIRFALFFFQFPLLISSSLFFFFFFFFLFLSQSSIAGNPFVSLASLSH